MSVSFFFLRNISVSNKMFRFKLLTAERDDFALPALFVTKTSLRQDDCWTDLHHKVLYELWEIWSSFFMNCKCQDCIV